MTQHLLPEQTAEDEATLRRLGLVIGVFIAATASMALVIGLVMG